MSQTIIPRKDVSQKPTTQLNEGHTEQDPQHSLPADTMRWQQGWEQEVQKIGPVYQFDKCVEYVKRKSAYT